MVAHGLVLAGARRVLVIGSETLSQITDWDDRSIAVLVGDGAGAVVLEATDGPGQLLAWDLGADGSLRHLLKCDHGGYLYMNGKEIFRHAVRVIVDSSQTALGKAGLTAGDVDLFVPHQANARIITAASQRLGIPDDRCVVTIDRYGNTSSASIPLALADALETGPPPPRRRRAALGLRGRDDLGERRPTMGRMTGDAAPATGPSWWCWPRAWPSATAAASRWHPLGLHGEAVIDLIAGDAVAAGFGDDRPRARARRRARPSATTCGRCFPPRSTSPSPSSACRWAPPTPCSCARTHVGDGPFAVVNADDVYGAPALALLAGHLGDGDEHAIVAYRLRDTIVADAPVTRGTCAVGPDGSPAAPGGAAGGGAPTPTGPSTSATASSRPCSPATRRSR